VPRVRRSWPAVIVSAVLHLLVLAPVLYFARDTVAAALPRAAHALVFVSAVPAPDPAFVVPLAPRKTPPKPVDPIVAFTRPSPAIEPVPARIAPTPVTPDPRKAAPARVEPPTAAVAPPAPRVVNVGTFAASVPTARTTDPVRSVQSTGFDAQQAARAPELRSAPAVTGAFDPSAASAQARSGSDRAAVVTDAGFGAMNSAAPAGREHRAVADAGFGGQPAAATRSAAPSALRSAGFDAPPPAAAASQPVRPARIDVPIEILSKPMPAYTDEARALKLEGEVVLEVEFGAKGDVRVLRLVTGLGHGLDEAAARAAEAIRFKPALTSGRPVDFRSTVHIVFRLA